MKDNKLRKLNKKELLEILLAQSKRIEELEESLTITKAKLYSKNIIISESGSLAEACLKLNNIFEIAQKTADQYIDNIKEKYKEVNNEDSIENKDINNNKNSLSEYTKIVSTKNTKYIKDRPLKKIVKGTKNNE